MRFKKVYVAGKVGDERVVQVMDWLRARRHRITVDWTAADGKLTGAELNAAGHQANRDVATRDLDGVAEADALVLVVVDPLPYKGPLWEAGFAQGRGIPIFVIGTALDSTPFIHGPGVKRWADFPGAEKWTWVEEMTSS